MDETPAPGVSEAPDTGEAKPFGDLLTETKSSRSLRNGILVLGFIFTAWVATWVLTGSPLFGFLGALAILAIVRTVFPGRARSLQSQRPRRR